MATKKAGAKCPIVKETNATETSKKDPIMKTTSKQANIPTAKASKLTPHFSYVDEMDDWAKFIVVPNILKMIDEYLMKISRVSWDEGDAHTYYIESCSRRKMLEVRFSEEAVDEDDVVDCSAEAFWARRVQFCRGLERGMDPCHVEKVLEIIRSEFEGHYEESYGRSDLLDNQDRDRRKLYEEFERLENITDADVEAEWLGLQELEDDDDEVEE